MWSTHNAGIGSYYYNNFPLTIDQFLASKGGILKGSKLQVGRFSDGGKVKIEMLPEMTSSGRYPNPIRFGRPSSRSSYHPDTGYSDHYPISIILNEK
jgi:hypothetical protein